jgi:uncharacterized protein YwqG
MYRLQRQAVSRFLLTRPPGLLHSRRILSNQRSAAEGAPMGKARRYRAGQRCAFRCSLTEFEHTLVIGNVLGPPHWKPTEYEVYVRYNRATGVWTPPGVDGVNLTLKAEGLDRSVTELLDSHAELPEWWRYGQEQDLPDRPRAMTSLGCEEVEEGLRHTIERERYLEEGRRRAARAVSREEVIRQLAPWREAHRRPAWKPRTESRDGDVTASKFSGAPWLGKGEDWPACPGCRRPLQLFLQLNLSQLPAELGSRYGGGLLQLFYCRHTEEGECTAGGGYQAFNGPKVVRVVQPEGRPKGRPRIGEGSFPPKTIVGWDRVDDSPNGQDHDQFGLDYRYDFALGTVDVFCNEPKLAFENQKSSGLAEAISSALPGDKLAGWPCWIQHAEYPKCPHCRRRMDLVFQIDSNDNLPYMFGDSGCGHITQCPEHKDVVAFAWACC